MIIVFLFWCLIFVRIFCLQKINSTIIKVQKLFTFDLPYFWSYEKDKKKRIRRENAIKNGLKVR